jgi:SagB-type dehydrogenase family enzyme
MTQTIILPKPDLHGKLSLEAALAKRRSVREYRPDPLQDKEIGQLLWAAQGITDPTGRRTAPSAGALLALELYVVTHAGMYQYEPQSHALVFHLDGDLRQKLSAAALDQECVLKAAAVFVITADYERLARKYGEERSQRYAYMEAGHAAQNLLLQAVALGLAAVPAGAFTDDQVKEVLQLPADQQPLYLIPVGYPK